MRYIGNKENVIPRMYEILIHKGIAGRSLFDFLGFIYLITQSLPKQFGCVIGYFNKDN